jgi:hypothetical protein
MVVGEAMGVEVTINGVQLVTYPEAATVELRQGELPDRQALLLEQLTAYSGILTRRIDEAATVGSACMPDAVGTGTKNLVGLAGMACNNRCYFP